MPFVLEFKTGKEGTSLQQDEFIKKKSEAIKEARLLGVRPMEIGRLLTYLGYDYHAPVRGRPEAVDNAALKRLLGPKQRDLSKPAGITAAGGRDRPTRRNRMPATPFARKGGAVQGRGDPRLPLQKGGSEGQCTVSPGQPDVSHQRRSMGLTVRLGGPI